MEHEILLFGILTDLIGGKKISIEIQSKTTVRELKAELAERFPKLIGSVPYSVAVNMEYAHDDVLIQSGDTIALIPPVSGG